MIRSYHVLLQWLHVLFDALMIGLAFYLAWHIKFNTGWLNSMDESIGPRMYFVLGAFMIPVFLFMNAVCGLYSTGHVRRIRSVGLRLVKSTIYTALVMMSLLFFVKEIHVSREMLALYFILTIMLLFIERLIMRGIMLRIRHSAQSKKFILIIGAGVLGRKVLQLMGQQEDFGFDVIGFLDDRLYPQVKEIDGVKLLGTIDELVTVLEGHLLDQVVLALPIDAHHRLAQIIEQCEKFGVQTLIIPDYFDYLPAKPRFEEVSGIPMIDVRHVPLDDIRNAVLKRAFDIAFSLCVLVVLFPLLLLLAIGVKVTSPGPVFFGQERVGKNRRLFKMYKFRSMRVSISKVSDMQWTTSDDSRKTKFGALLRKTSLDELPQFFNVLKGDMSIVGPRPERPYFVDQFKEDIPKYMVKHRVRPGITGWAQVNGWRGDTSITERIKCDIDYIENWTFGMDLKITMQTVVNGFINKNAY